MASSHSSPARLRASSASGRSSSARSSSSLASPRPTCLCSPTNHPGSFRCSMHRSQSLRGCGVGRSSSPSSPSSSSLLDAKAKAKAKDLRSLLLAMIRPSRQDLYRRRNFQPQPTRFCLMNNAGDLEHQLPGVLAS